MQDVPYDLPHLKLPRLSGFPLRLMAAGLANPITRPLLLPTFLKNGGVTEFRHSRVEHPPTFLPLGPLPEEQVDAASPPTDFPPFPGPPVEGHRPLRIRDLHEAYREKALSPEEIAQRVIRAIESSTDQGLNWWIATDPDVILEQARASARRWAKGIPLGWLDGIPVAIKDEMDAAPYHPEHDTGGSSSGSAAVVAAGQAPLALGADGGGSIRIPAAFCGVVGLKPTFGRVSTAGGFALAWTVGHFGPIGATVEDVAIGYLIMAGREPLDPTTHHQPPPTLACTHKDSLAGLRVGIDPLWNQDTDPSYGPVLQRVRTLLAEAGAEVITIRLPHLNRARVAHVIAILAEMATALAPYRNRHRELGWGTRVLLELGRAFTARDYLLAARARTEAMEYLREHFKQVDVILTPASAVPAPPVPSNLKTGTSDPSLITEIMRFAFLANLTGVPALVLPAGYTENGLPLGIQLMGRWWEEDRLLQIGRVLEAHLPRHAPRIYWNLLSG